MDLKEIKALPARWKETARQAEASAADYEAKGMGSLAHAERTMVLTLHAVANQLEVAIELVEVDLRDRQ